MFCGPRSEHPHTGFWNYNYECKCIAYTYIWFWLSINHSLIRHSMLTVLLPYFHQATKDGRTLPSLVMCTKIKRRASMTIRVHMPTQVSAFCSFVNRFTKSFVSSSLTSLCMQIWILAGRTDVEGCCWWGRGVIQTSGVWWVSLYL